MKMALSKDTRTFVANFIIIYSILYAHLLKAKYFLINLGPIGGILTLNLSQSFLWH